MMNDSESSVEFVNLNIALDLRLFTFSEWQNIILCDRLNLYLYVERRFKHTTRFCMARTI